MYNVRVSSVAFLEIRINRFTDEKKMHAVDLPREACPCTLAQTSATTPSRFLASILAPARHKHRATSVFPNLAARGKEDYMYSMYTVDKKKPTGTGTTTISCFQTWPLGRKKITSARLKKNLKKPSHHAKSVFPNLAARGKRLYTVL
jgi:hypothetical protein